MEAKENLLRKIRISKNWRGFSTTSSEKDAFLKARLENAEKSIMLLQSNESNLLRRISILEDSERSLIRSVKELKWRIINLEQENNTFIKKYSNSEFTQVVDDKHFNSKEIIPSIVQALKYGRLLDNEDEPVKHSIQKSPDVVWESLNSTDENYLGVTDVKPKINIFKNDPSKVWRKMFKRKMSKSAIGPKNLEMKKCHQARNLGEPAQSATVRSRMITCMLNS